MSDEQDAEIAALRSRCESFHKLCLDQNATICNLQREAVELRHANLKDRAVTDDYSDNPPTAPGYYFVKAKRPIDQTDLSMHPREHLPAVQFHEPALAWVHRIAQPTGAGDTTKLFVHIHNSTIPLDDPLFLDAMWKGPLKP